MYKLQGKLQSKLQRKNKAVAQLQERKNKAVAQIQVRKKKALEQLQRERKKAEERLKHQLLLKHRRTVNVFREVKCTSHIICSGDRDVA